MNPLRRYETIMEILLAQKEVTVNELSERLDVTGKTIREDLAKLEEKGLLVRIHGGAMLAQSDQLGILSAKEPIIKHADQEIRNCDDCSAIHSATGYYCPRWRQYNT